MGNYEVFRQMLDKINAEYGTGYKSILHICLLYMFAG